MKPSESIGAPRRTGFWFSASIGALLTALCLSGCAGYQLGTGSTPAFVTLFIAPVSSEALVPQARMEFTTQIREAFVRDGRLKLVESPAAADAVLEVTIARYGRNLAVSQPHDTGLARRFDVDVQIRATLRNSRTQVPFFTDRTLEAKRGAFTDDGLVPSERQILSVLAEAIADEAVHAVMDTW